MDNELNLYRLCYRTFYKGEPMLMPTTKYFIAKDNVQEYMIMRECEKLATDQMSIEVMEIEDLGKPQVVIAKDVWGQPI